jgi:uncharacterized repeat protein (TIGR02543 family)
VTCRSRIQWVALLGLLLTFNARAAFTVSPWVPIFKGVDYATGTADTNEVRLQKVFAIRVDLLDPDVEFFSTPSNGADPLETTSQTTSQFLLSNSLQVAINANFFSPCCSGPEPKDLLGLAISRGEVVSPITTSGAGTEAILVTSNNQALVTNTTASTVLSDYWTAVAGSPRTLRNGLNLGGELVAHPRTAVGVSQDNRYLYMIAIDGRQPGWSDGATMPEVGDWLLRFGAWNGLNLDGGGSTAMVKAESGAATTLNRPSGGVQRQDGNNFGLFTKNLAPGFAAQPQSRDILQGTDMTFTVSAFGTTPLRYQWRFNGTNLPGATCTSYSITNAQLSHTGTYQVMVTNGVGTNASTPAILNVNYGLNTNSTLGGIIAKNPNVPNHVPNSMVTLTAVPDPGFVFTGWSGDVSGTNNPTTISMTGHKSVTASFSGTVPDLIIDNTNATIVGTWTSSNTPAGFYGTNYLTAATVAASGSPTRTATYRPMIYTPGRYATFIWHPADSTRSTNAPWKLVFQGGTNLVRVNQAASGGNWRLILPGKDLVRGTSAFLELGNNASGTARVMADAVKFVHGFPPLLATHPTPQTVTAGSPVTFTSGATGTAPLSYQWMLNGNSISGATNSIYSITNSQAGHSGTYSALATNLFGSATSSNAVLVVNTPPSITAQPQSQSVAQAVNVTFSVSANGTAPLFYQWQVNSTNLPAATNSSLIITNVQSTDAGLYSVGVSNLVNTIVSSNAVLTVNSAPVAPSVMQQPVPQLVIAGQTAIFSAGVNGTLPLFFQWQCNGTNLPNAHTSTLTLPNAQIANVGSYRLIASNSAGTNASTTAALTVNFSLTTVATLGGTLTRSTNLPSYSPGSVITLTASADSNFVFTGWSGDLTGTNNPLTFAFASNMTIVAAFSGSVADLIIDNNAATYTGGWTVGNSAAGRYGVDYHFANTTNGAPSATATYRPTIRTSGKYNVYLWYPQGSNRASNAPWLIDYENGAETVLVDQTINGGSWLPIGAAKPLAAGTNEFVRLGNDANNSVVIADAVRFTFVLPLQIVSQPQNRTAYPGEAPTFTVDVNSALPVIYQWRHNGINLAGATNNFLQLTNVQLIQAGRYSVLVGNVEANLLSASAMLAVFLPTAPQLTAPELLPGGRLKLVFIAATNFTYQLEQSTNLTAWTAFTNFLHQNNPADILIETTNQEGGFYRATWVP